uniref:PHD-type domain-containing protein n=1 Tax=Daucus carota subsp. sativus TaxID=79200 RepID=A0A164XUU3_DAUCS
MDQESSTTAYSPPPPPPGGCQVRCAGCHNILSVGQGVTEFVCPNCRLPQMLPPELLPLPSAPAHGIDPTKIQLPCAHCKAILNVPHGLTRFNCPQCNFVLSVDLSKISRPPPWQHQQFTPPPPLPPPPPEEVNEVAMEVEREEDSGGVVGETFTDYRPPKLSIGPPHPDPVVETASLSAVQPPEPTYDLRIKDDLESSKVLSCLQIETIVYASQRHLQHLPDGTRAGFFVGDGAGVGKGRTIAGLILENWQHERRKTLWISVGSDLKFDARRDLDDVGAMFIEVHALNKLSYSKLDSKSVGVREGVVFLTYSSLIASSEKGRSRMQQLVQWCGPEYDGLIVFDECHKAKNLVPEAGSQPTRTGEAVLEIQAKLPDARVIYCSATGASEPRNMGYMIRLGLWGTGTSFLDFRDFLGSLERGGVGALELVAMDMKARGMYLCRTLSYKGAEFDVIEVPLEDNMMDMYKRAAQFWTKLRMELLSASAILTSEKPNSSQLWRLYWANHQRFFRHMCMSAKVPAVVRICSEALAKDKCIVIGLQSTGEARTEEAVTKYGADLDDFISGPRELLLKFVDENYPLPEKPESLSGDDGVKELQRKRHSATPGVSYRGRVRKAARLQDESDVESDLESESDSDPDCVESDDEFQICDICNSETERKKLLQCSCCKQLMHPACLVPPVVGAVPADWSCHSCKEKTEEYLQNRRVYLAQLLEWYEKAEERKSQILDAVRSLDLPNNPLDDIIDQLGGPDKVAEITGRRRMLVRSSDGKGVTYQARNTLLFSNLGGERRFASIVAKRLESLGALTQGDRRAGPSLSAYNYDSAYGKRALVKLYKGLLEQESLPVVPPGCSTEKPDTIQDFIEKGKAALVSVGIIRDGIVKESVVGDKEPVKLSGRIVDSDMHDVGRFLNRLLGVPPDVQNLLFELFVSILDLLVQNARLEGHFDSGIADMRANTIELKGTPKNVHMDHLSGASTVLFTFTLDRGFTWEAASVLLDEKRKDLSASSSNGFYESKREWLGRRHYLLAYEGANSSIDVQCMHGPNCKLGDYCTTGRRLQEVNVLGGLILPVWGIIEKAITKQARESHRRLRIVRVETTTDNKRIVGLLIPNAVVNSILKDNIKYKLLNNINLSSDLAWVQDIDD